MRLWSAGAQTRSSCIFAYSRKPALESPRLTMAQGFDARSSNDKGLEHVIGRAVRHYALAASDGSNLKLLSQLG